MTQGDPTAPTIIQSTANSGLGVNFPLNSNQAAYEFSQHLNTIMGLNETARREIFTAGQQAIETGSAEDLRTFEETLNLFNIKPDDQTALRKIVFSGANLASLAGLELSSLNTRNEPGSNEEEKRKSANLAADISLVSSVQNTLSTYLANNWTSLAQRALESLGNTINDPNSTLEDKIEDYQNFQDELRSIMMENPAFSALDEAEQQKILDAMTEERLAEYYESQGMSPEEAKIKARQSIKEIVDAVNKNPELAQQDLTKRFEIMEKDQAIAKLSEDILGLQLKRYEINQRLQSGELSFEDPAYQEYNNIKHMILILQKEQQQKAEELQKEVAKLKDDMLGATELGNLQSKYTEGHLDRVQAALLSEAIAANGLEDLRKHFYDSNILTSEKIAGVNIGNDKWIFEDITGSGQYMIVDRNYIDHAHMRIATPEETEAIRNAKIRSGLRIGTSGELYNYLEAGQQLTNKQTVTALTQQTTGPAKAELNGIQTESASGETQTEEDAPAPAPDPALNLYTERKGTIAAYASMNPKGVTEAELKEFLHDAGIPAHYLDRMVSVIQKEMPELKITEMQAQNQNRTGISAAPAGASTLKQPFATAAATPQETQPKTAQDIAMKPEEVRTAKAQPAGDGTTAPGMTS